MNEWLQAAECGDVEAITAFLAAGMGVNASTGSGETCLMRAAMHGQTRVVELLLGQGAEIDACQANGKTALSLASFFGHASVVSILLRQGANAQLPDNLGVTAYDWAMSRGQFEIAQQLRASAAELSIDPPRSAHESAVVAASEEEPFGEDEPLELPPAAERYEEEVTLVLSPPTGQVDEPPLVFASGSESALRPVLPATNGGQRDAYQTAPLMVAPAREQASAQNLMGSRRQRQTGALRARIRINERKKVHRTINTALNLHKPDEVAPPRAIKTAQTALTAKQLNAESGPEPVRASAVEAKAETRRHTLSIALAMFATFGLSSFATWRLLGPSMLSDPSVASRLTPASSQNAPPAAQPTTDIRPALNMPPTDAPKIKTVAHDTAANRRDASDEVAPKKTKQTGKQEAGNELASSENKTGKKPHEREPYVVSQPVPEKEARTKRAETTPPARHSDSSNNPATAAQPITKTKVNVDSPTATPVNLPMPAPKPKKKVIPWP